MVKAEEEDETTCDDCGELMPIEPCPCQEAAEEAEEKAAEEGDERAEEEAEEKAAEEEN